jgi:hypothetical protein
MKTIQRNIYEIGGEELTQKEKSFFRGGEGGGCPVLCQLWDSGGDIDKPACCPYEDPEFCEDELEGYYHNLTPPLWYYAFCYPNPEQ